MITHPFSTVLPPLSQTESHLEFEPAYSLQANKIVCHVNVCGVSVFLFAADPENC